MKSTSGHAIAERLGQLLEKLRAQSPSGLGLPEGLRLRLRFANPAGAVLVDFEKTPFEIHVGDSRSPARLEIEMHTEDADEFLSGRLRLGEAWKDGKIRVRGAIWRLWGLKELLEVLSRMYRKSQFPRERRESSQLRSAGKHRRARS